MNFFKKGAEWGKTIFVLGVPRSGKSTVASLIARQGNHEILDEPFPIISLAQKSTLYSQQSKTWKHLHDLYLSNLENSFFESCMGRSFNFRPHDQSFIKNYKRPAEIKKAFALKQKKDAYQSLQKNPKSLILVLNDVEKALKFLTWKIQKPKILFIKRKINNISHEIAKKNWMKNSSLASRCNLLPAYQNKIQKNNKIIYLPYFIKKPEVHLFLSASNAKRALLYATYQTKAYLNALKKMKHINYKIIEFEQILEKPEQTLSDIRQFLFKF